jgi:hypothetical protein
MLNDGKGNLVFSLELLRAKYPNATEGCIGFKVKSDIPGVAQRHVAYLYYEKQNMRCIPFDKPKDFHDRMERIEKGEYY